MIKKKFHSINEKIIEQEFDIAIKLLRKIDESDEIINLAKVLTEIKIYLLTGDLKNAFASLNDNILTKEIICDLTPDLTEITIEMVKILVFQYNKFEIAFNIIEKFKKNLEIIKMKTENDNKCLGEIVHLTGTVNWYKGNYNESLINWKESVKIFESISDETSMALSVHNIGLYHWGKGDHNTALEYYETSRAIHQKLNNKDKLAQVINDIGVIYFEQGFLDNALEHYKQSKAIHESLKNKNGIAIALNNIGEVTRSKGDLEESLDNFNQAALLEEKYGSKNTLTIIFDNIGKIYFTKGELDDALDYFKKSLAIRKEINNEKLIASSLNELGHVYQSKGDFSEAFNCFNDSLNIRIKHQNEIEIAETLFSLVLLCCEIKQLDKANNFYKEMKEIRSKESNKIIAQQIKLACAFILKSSNRLQKRAEAQKIFTTVSKEPIVKHELTVFAMINACESLLYELQKIGEDFELYSELEQILSLLSGIAKNQNSFTLLIQVFLIEAKIALIKEGDFNKAKMKLQEARIASEMKRLWKLHLIISTEELNLIQQEQQWKNIVLDKSDLGKRFELAQPEKIIDFIVKNKLGKELIIPEFVLANIKISLVKMSDSGPTVVKHEKLLFTEDSYELLTKMGTIFTFSIGQGNVNGTNIGLYGPLPVPSYPNYESIVFSFYIKDKSYSDPRAKGKTYAILIFVLPKSLINLFFEREKIAQNLSFFLSSFKDIEEITINKLKNIKLKLFSSN